MKNLLMPCLFVFFLSSFKAMGVSVVNLPADSVYATNSNSDCKIKVIVKGGSAVVTMDGKTSTGKISRNKNSAGIYDFTSNGKLVFMFMYEEDKMIIVNQDYRFSCSAAKVIELEPVNTSCFEESKYTLPYDQRHLPGKTTWKKLECSLEGVDEYLCNEDKLRYLSLPSFKDVHVLLIPMDCGDFGYYWYMLTVLGNKIVGVEYVEGIWYEPGEESYKEYTHFTIDTSYKITVTTDADKNGKRSLKSKDVYQLQSNGVLKKM